LAQKTVSLQNGLIRFEKEYNITYIKELSARQAAAENVKNEYKIKISI
jgi:hypothetical protein